MSEENKNLNDGENAANINKETEESVESAEPVEELDSYNFDIGRLYEGEEEAPAPEKAPMRLSVATFIISAVALILAAVMTTWYFCYGFYRSKLSEVADNKVVLVDDSEMLIGLDRLSAIFKTFSYFEIDEDEMAETLFRAYVYSTGDKYAEYYTSEEHEELRESAFGYAEGIGINIIYTVVTIDETEHKVIKVTNVNRQSPAKEAGLEVGDLIFYVGNDEETRESVALLGYEEALSRLQGESGTIADFTVLRESDDGSFEEIPFSIERQNIVSESVMYHVCQTDESVGIVRITGFDYTTPSQFSEAVDALLAAGADKFVFDVRHNGGGELASIAAVLSYFLNEGDVILSTVDKDGRDNVRRVGVVNSSDEELAGCNVSREDIGKYKDLRLAVLCDERTASAAELFTATFRDYNMGKIVGTTTYGKGSMQTVISLGYFGLEGAIKLTTNMYFPPCGESYEGIGIVPHIEVELDEALSNKNFYEFTDAEDNQLQAAIETLK